MSFLRSLSLTILSSPEYSTSCVLHSPHHASELLRVCIDTSFLTSRGFFCASWFLQPAFLLLCSGAASSIGVGTKTQIYKAQLNEISSEHPKIVFVVMARCCLQSSVDKIPGTPAVFAEWGEPWTLLLWVPKLYEREEGSCEASICCT